MLAELEIKMYYTMHAKIVRRFLALLWITLLRANKGICREYIFKSF